MLIAVVIAASVGLLVCLYGAYIERKVQLDSHYKALCDISDQASCTKTFLSPWAKLLGVSNLYVGIIFYVAMIVLGLLEEAQLAFLGAVGACLASVVLAYILYAKVRTFCLLCSTIYIINSVLLAVTYFRL